MAVDFHSFGRKYILTLSYFEGFCSSSFEAGPPWKATQICLHIFHVSLHLWILTNMGNGVRDSAMHICEDSRGRTPWLIWTLFQNFI